jgi:MoxR-like ATPase
VAPSRTRTSTRLALGEYTRTSTIDEVCHRNIALGTDSVEQHRDLGTICCEIRRILSRVHRTDRVHCVRLVPDRGAGQGSGIVRLVTPADVSTALSAQGYLPDEGISTSVFLAMTLHRPLLLEGEAGVGKTELAKSLAKATGGELIRLQCYEGIDASQAVYDWDYAKQLLHLRATEATGESQSTTADALEAELYGERFLIKRALLRSIEPTDGPPPVLLIDEVDRADDEFEAYLLEILSDFQVTVPEVGRFTTDRPPIVVLTSNRTRDVHDALKRRCLYHWVEHPSFDREVEIVKLRVPGVDDVLAKQVAAAVEGLRSLNLYKPPGVAETIDWATALGRLGAKRLDDSVVEHTLGTVLKYREDHQRVEQHGIGEIVKQAIEKGLLHA